ncbi:MAG: response regulator [Ferruginibacter sp.]
MEKKLNCILLIDDDEPTNFLSTILIEEEDCTKHLQIAESGRQALNYLSNVKDESCDGNTSDFQPDLIFLDINMPCMNGWEFLEQYRQIKKDGNTKPVIIMLTTSLNPDDKLKSEGIPDVSGYENKPLTIEMLRRVIDQHFTPACNQIKTTASVRNAPLTRSSVHP